MRWLAAVLLVCCCSCKNGEHLDTLFETARASLHAGELAKAQTESERGIAIAAGRHDVQAQWRFRLLRAEILLNLSGPEQVLAQLSDGMPAGPAFATLAARKKMLQGQALSILGRTADADALIAQAHREADAAGAQDVILDIEVVQGAILLQRRLYDEAERILHEAQERARALNAPYSEGSALVNLGVTEMRMHHYEEAAGYFEQASVVSGPRFQILYSMARNNLAMCYLNMGEQDRAIAIQLDSIKRHERAGAKVYLLGALGAVGESYLNKGELQSAIPYLQQALSLANELNRTGDAAISAGNLANVYLDLGDWRNAEAFNQEAVRLKNSVHSHTLYYNVLNAAGIAAAKGEAEEARRLYRETLEEGSKDPAVLWAAYEGLGVMAAKGHDPDGAVREFDAAVDLLEKTRSDLRRTEFKLPFLTRRIRLYQEYIDVLIGQGQIERALAVADSSRAQVLAERSGAPPVRQLAPGAFLKLARQSGSVLLSYWLGPSQSYAFVVTAREIHYVSLPAASQIEPLAAAFHEAIERQLADPLRTRLPAGEKLYELLVAPVRPWIPAGSRVVLVPDGVLHGLNLEALPMPGEPPRYFIQDVTLEIAPSLALWGGATGAPEPGRRLLLLGDPVSNDPAFPRLTQAAREIESVRRQFPASGQVVLTHESATPQAYLAAAGGPFAAIHFTAHAVANGENPLESAVLLSGAKLYARDVMDKKLDAGLVTISSCRGAGSRTYSGEGLVGFAWAFLRAGARHVIAGLWDVNDQSTADLMDVLYRELAAGKRPAEALRAAKLALIESRGNLRKPYYWAPFQLYTMAP